jgi:hypothetical protein
MHMAEVSSHCSDRDTLKTFIKFPLNRSYAAADITPFPSEFGG